MAVVCAVASNESAAVAGSLVVIDVVMPGVVGAAVVIVLVIVGDCATSFLRLVKRLLL